MLIQLPTNKRHVICKPIPDDNEKLNFIVNQSEDHNIIMLVSSTFFTCKGDVTC